MNLAEAIPAAGVDTNKELIALTLVTVGGWIGLIINSRLDTRRDRSGRDEVKSELVTEVQGQVVNGHRDFPPLRVDVDKLLSGMEILTTKVDGLTGLARSHGRDINGLREDLGELRGEVRDGRQEHFALERRTDAFIKRVRLNDAD